MSAECTTRMVHVCVCVHTSGCVHVHVHVSVCTNVRVFVLLADSKIIWVENPEIVPSHVTSAQYNSRPSANFRPK